MALDLYIDEPIGSGMFLGGISAKMIRKQVIDAGTVDEINVYINSPGGDAADAATIYNILREHPATINVFVQGIAASAASLVAMAGDTVNMAENSLMMIHSPMTIAMGKAKDLRAAASYLDKVQQAIVTSYVKKTGQTQDEITKMMGEETWLTSQEAIDKGFADNITDPIEVINKFDLSVFNKVPKEIDNIVYNFAKKSILTPKFTGFVAKESEISLALNNVTSPVKMEENKPMPELENKEKEELLALRKEKAEIAFENAKLIALAPFQAVVIAGQMQPALFDRIKVALEGQKKDFEVIGKLMIPSELVFDIAKSAVALPKGEKATDESPKIPDGRADDVIVKLTQQYMAEHNLKDYQTAFKQVAILHPEAINAYIAPIRKEEKADGRYF